MKRRDPLKIIVVVIMLILMTLSTALFVHHMILLGRNGDAADGTVAIVMLITAYKLIDTLRYILDA